MVPLFLFTCSKCGQKLEAESVSELAGIVQVDFSPCPCLGAGPLPSLPEAAPLGAGAGVLPEVLDPVGQSDTSYGNQPEA